MMTQDCSFFFAFEDLALSLPYTHGFSSIYNLWELLDHLNLACLVPCKLLEGSIHLDITARYKANDGNRTRVACAASACFI